jgi:hypothetical protein
LSIFSGEDQLTAGESQLQTWLDATGLYSGTLQFNLIYEKASGDTSTAFHSAADGQGPTITLISATANGVTNTIGGFNPQSWNSSSGYNVVSNPSDRTAFIFDLTTADLRPEISGSAGQKQTYNGGDYGPLFGGGNDIYSDLNVGYLNPFSYGTGCGDSCAGQTNFFGQPGLTHFTVGQTEVYTISQVAAVPEAPTWAMMLLGFMGLGFAAYRKNGRPNLRLA